MPALISIPAILPRATTAAGTPPFETISQWLEQIARYLPGARISAFSSLDAGLAASRLPLARQFLWTLRKRWLSPLTAWLTPAPRRSQAQPRPCCFRIGRLMLFSSPWFCTTFVVPSAIYEVRLVIKPGGKLPIRTPASRLWTHISLPSCLKPPALEFSPLLIACGNSGSAERWRFQTQRAHHGAALR